MKKKYILLCFLMPHVLHAMESQSSGVPADDAPGLAIFRDLVFPDDEGEESPFGPPTGEPIPIPSEEAAQQFIQQMMLHQKELTTDCAACKKLSDDLCAACTSLRSCFNCSKGSADQLCPLCQTPQLQEKFAGHIFFEQIRKPLRDEILCHALCMITTKEPERLQYMEQLKVQINPEIIDGINSRIDTLRKFHRELMKIKYPHLEIKAEIKGKKSRFK